MIRTSQWACCGAPKALAVCVVMVGVALATVAQGSPVSGAAGCQITSVGLDTSYAGSSAGFYALAFNGRALAQVFLAEDTVISAITVWRPASLDTLAYGMHLYICRADSNLKPVPGQVLLDGPTIVLPVAGPDRAPVTYSFDPPFALPGPGHYTLAIKEEFASCFGAIVLEADSLGRYPDGGGWVIHPFVDCHGLGSNSVGFPFDLIFDVQFCRPVTPTLPTSWGKLKAKYR